MKDRLKTLTLIFLIIVIASLLTWLSYIIIVDKNIKEANSNIVNNEIATNINETETASSSVRENKIEKTDEKDEKKIETQEIKNNEEAEKEKVENQTNEEKAINAVKKAWGSEQGVYFASMGIDANGRYIVSVNDSATSVVYGWYSVDIDTGEVKAQ